MPIIKTETETVFDLTSITRGDLIRAKKSTWTDTKNGIVTAVTKDRLTVMFLLENGVSYYEITADELLSTSWVIKWTTDMITINTHSVAV